MSKLDKCLPEILWRRELCIYQSTGQPFHYKSVNSVLFCTIGIPSLYLLLLWASKLPGFLCRWRYLEVSGLWGPCRSKPETVQDCQRSLAQLLLSVSGSVLLSLPVYYRPAMTLCSGKYKNKFQTWKFPFWCGLRGWGRDVPRKSTLANVWCESERATNGPGRARSRVRRWEQPFPGCPSTLTLHMGKLRPRKNNFPTATLLMMQVPQGLFLVQLAEPALHHRMPP